MRFTDRNGDRASGATPPVTMLGRTLALLEAFGSDEQRLSLAELTRRAGLPKPTVYRMASDMVRERILDRLEDGTYRLGLRLFEIGERVPTPRSLSEAALPIMEDLRQATGQRTHLAVLEGVDVVYVVILDGRTPMVVGSRRGGRFPAHATGVGKAILAFSPEQVLLARVEAGLPRLTPRTICTPGELRREMDAVRARGYANDREESHVGISCVAAPVFGQGGQVRAALSITGRTRSVAPARLAAAVCTAANTLSRALRESRL